MAECNRPSPRRANPRRSPERSDESVHGSGGSAYRVNTGQCENQGCRGAACRGPTPRHPERYSHRFVEQAVQACRALGEDQLPKIRLHDLRHTRATLLLAAGEPVKVVSERLGHASTTITLTVYQHVHSGLGRQAADRFAALLRG
ncbi:tyrosine-type recombinase/integrase [Blastococcus saxobsidens]|uniref:Tyrosine-type recombinase/integrase n=1 Tax=Blastococcus saxobsidens TaxID=138336 RepID=A0A6L9W528_9ACTN|nr:tyrosine-type recombinase/integrase [Blastococcus saxobsidens]NEK86879.1 tyrosine-type recombinase/integrase [Blastococcus saxobsidens]